MVRRPNTQLASKSMHKILLLDDCARSVRAVSRVLRHDAVECFTSPRSALNALARDDFTIVVSDWVMPQMPGPIFLVEAQLRRPHSGRILHTAFLSSVTSAELSQAVNEQAVDCVVEKGPPTSLLEALDVAAQLSAQRRAMAQLAQSLGRPSLRGIGPLAVLTPRELEVCRCLVRGLRPSSIARELVLSPHTVRNHIRSARKKLDAASIEALITSARPWMGVEPGAS